MKEVRHLISHLYQPTNTSCGQTSLTMLMNYYGNTMTPDQVIAEVPRFYRDNGDDAGTNACGLGLYALHHGHHAAIYTFDHQVINPAWKDLSQSGLHDALLDAVPYRDVDRLGRDWTRIYLESYASFIAHRGSLHIEHYPSSALMYRLLAKGPFVVSVVEIILHHLPHSKETALRTNADDPKSKGNALNHFVVVYGNDEDGNFLIADPWEEPGYFCIEPERLIAAISATEIECDNMILQILPKS